MFPLPNKLAQNAAPPAPDFKMDGKVMEPKYDGFRLLAEVTDSGANLYTRTGSNKTAHLPHIAQVLSTLPTGTWLDGEVCVFDEDGAQEWGKVQTICGGNPAVARVHEQATYVVFDCMAFNSDDIRPLPLEHRRAAVSVIVDLVATPCVILAPQRPATQEAHDAMVADGWEGSIVKDPAKPYASGKRGHGWTKLKASDEMDVVIMGYKPGENSFRGMVGAIIFGQYKPCDECGGDGKDIFEKANGRVAVCPKCNASGVKTLTERGRCSGMDMKMRKHITAHQSELVGSVISIAHMGIMPSGSPRHPQYKRFRTDKPASDCEWT